MTETFTCIVKSRPVDRGGSVGSDEPPRLPNGPLEVLRKLLYWPLLTPQITVTSSVELKTAVIRLRTASLHRYAVDQCRHELFNSIDTPLMNN